MKLTREEALKVMVFHGFKNAARWSNADLQTKLAQVPDVMIKGKVPEDEETKKLHEAVLATCEKKEAFEVTGEEPKKEEKKEKPAPAEKAASPYERIRPGNVAAFKTGVVFKEFGIEKGVTDAMIARYNELAGKVNNEVAITNLTWAWQVIHGYLKPDAFKAEEKKEDTKAA